MSTPPSTSDPLARIRVAYRKMVLFRDRAVWDFGCYVGQGFRSPVHTDIITPSGRILTATTEAGITYVERDYGSERDWWEFEDIYVPIPNAEHADRWADDEIEAKIQHNAAHPEDPWGYDWDGVERFVFMWAEEAPYNWFCSEVATRYLIEAGALDSSLYPWQMSPAALNRIKKRSWQ